MRCVVFLDIDGVLQPLRSQDRFAFDLEALQVRLVGEADPGYAELNRYDIGAVQHDWYPPAVSNLKELCQRGDARIVVSSAWREGKTLGQLKLLFRIHELDMLIHDMVPELHSMRDLQIEAFLVAHPEIERFVVIDDGYVDSLLRRFPGEFVRTRDHFDRPALEQALRVLRRSPRAQQRRVLARFDALLERDPALTSLRLTLADIGMIRRLRGYQAIELLGLLCEAVADCPNLASLTVRGIEHDFGFRERDEIKPIELLTEAARQNPALKKIDILDDEPERSRRAPVRR